MKSTLIALTLAAAASTAVAGDAKVDEAITAAIAAADRADSIGGEWRDTREIIKEAQAAAAAGDTEKALALATEAREQGELGYAQAAGQQ
ncbi:hypothetical protein [Endothiovibrio diazotrophicus]